MSPQNKHVFTYRMNGGMDKLVCPCFSF